MGNDVLDGRLAVCSLGELSSLSRHLETGVAVGEIDEVAWVALHLL